MTLQAISAELAPSTPYRHPVESSKTQQQVIGTMFGFLPRDLTQRSVRGSLFPVCPFHARSGDSNPVVSVVGACLAHFISICAPRNTSTMTTLRCTLRVSASPGNIQPGRLEDWEVEATGREFAWCEVIKNLPSQATSRWHNVLVFAQ